MSSLDNKIHERPRQILEKTDQNVFQLSAKQTKSIVNLSGYD